MTHCLFEQKFETRIQQKNSSMGDLLSLTLSNFYNARTTDISSKDYWVSTHPFRLIRPGGVTRDTAVADLRCDLWQTGFATDRKFITKGIDRYYIKTYL